MSTVDRVRVGDVLELQRRKVEVEPTLTYEEIGVRSFGRGIFHKEPVEGAVLGNKRVFRIEPGDLVISNVFGWEGAVALATEAEEGKIGSHRFMTFTARNGAIGTGWASWFFRSEPGLELIRQASPGSAGRNKTLAVQRFEDLVIALPPIEEQRKAASYLDGMRARAESVEHALAREGARAVTTMLPALVDEIIARKKATDARLSDLVDLVSDVVHPGDDQSPAEDFVGLQHVESNTGRQLGSDTLEGLKGRKFRFQPGDVVYGYLRPYLNKVWVADHAGLCSVDQYVLRPKAGVDAELIGYVLRGQATLDAAISLTHSLQLPRLRSGLLMSLHIPTVPDDSAEPVIARLNRVRDAAVELERVRARQAHAGSALLPAALHRVFGSA